MAGRRRLKAWMAGPSPAMTMAMTWRASVLTLFPEMFPGPLAQSLAGRALQSGDLVAGAGQYP